MLSLQDELVYFTVHSLSQHNAMHSRLNILSHCHCIIETPLHPRVQTQLREARERRREWRREKKSGEWAVFPSALVMRFFFLSSTNKHFHGWTTGGDSRCDFFLQTASRILCMPYQWWAEEHRGPGNLSPVIDTVISAAHAWTWRKQGCRGCEWGKDGCTEKELERQRSAHRGGTCSTE